MMQIIHWFDLRASRILFITDKKLLGDFTTVVSCRRNARVAKFLVVCNITTRT